MDGGFAFRGWFERQDDFCRLSFFNQAYQFPQVQIVDAKSFQRGEQMPQHKVFTLVLMHVFHQINF